MNWIDAVMIICAVALVAFTVVFNVVRAKKGKSACGCGGSCPAAKNGDCGSCGGCKDNSGDKRQPCSE